MSNVSRLDYRIIDEFKLKEIPDDLTGLLRRLEKYRKGQSINEIKDNE